MVKLSRNYIKEIYQIDYEIAKAYEDKVNRHIREVQKACAILGVDKEQATNHDMSKWSTEEFVPYALNPFDGTPPTEEFTAAWLHHIHCNPHHWEHWIFPTGKEYGEKGVLEMPENYALEMIADLMGSEVAYAGRTDMTEWLLKNIPKIVVHSNTARFLTKTLKELGYNIFDKVSFSSRL